VAREKVFEELMLQDDISSLEDILRILGSTRGGEWQIFRDRANDFVNTINLGKLKLKGYETMTKIRWLSIFLYNHNTIEDLKGQILLIGKLLTSTYFLVSSETNK